MLEEAQSIGFTNISGIEPSNIAYNKSNLNIKSKIIKIFLMLKILKKILSI